MAVNDFVPFCPTNTGTNLLSQSNYLTDPQLAIGNQPGVARSQLVNKALRQATYIAAAVAQFIANTTGNDVLDDATISEVITNMELTFSPYQKNYWSGFHDMDMTWSTTSTTYIDLTSIGTTPAITQRVGNITVTQAASSLPGITFTPSNVNAVFLITATLGLNSSIGTNNSLRLTDGTNVICTGGATDATNVENSVTLSAMYVPGVNTPVTLKIQGASNGGTLTLQALGSSTAPTSSIEWTVLQIQ